MSGITNSTWEVAAVPLRRRLDLELQPSFATTARDWLVKDPVALRYFELPEEEYFLWQRLDGQTTFNELRDAFERTFAPRTLTAAALMQMLDDLHRRGLIVSDRPGQAEILRQRNETERRSVFWRRFANPLAICLPGVNPQPLLVRIPLPLLSRAWRGLLIAGFVISLLAAVTMVVHVEDARRELLGTMHFPALDDWPLWIAAIITTKIMHEAAHALACRLYGGECREVGLLLLCGMPCLYCDVTSVWMTADRWKRIAVGAAGMFAEFLLAATAVLAWRFSEPGLVHAFCLHLAIVCSIGTILVNGNPLLRYDGYFILSDFVGITNLGERADHALHGALGNWFFGAKDGDEGRWRVERYRRCLAAYSLASAVYRWTLTIGVLWFVRQFLAPRGLTLLSDALTLMVAGSLVVPPARRVLRRIQLEYRERRGTMLPFAVRSAAMVGLLAAILLWPWPNRVAAPAVACLHEADFLYVVTGGRLIDAVAIGSRVQAGDLVAKLDNPQLRLETTRQEAEVARRRLEISNLERLRVADPTQADSLPTARESLKAAEQHWRHLTSEQEQLQVVTARSGIVLPQVSARASSQSTESPSTDVSPLEPSRRGAYVAPGTPLCAVGDPTRLEFQVSIDQHDIEFVATGQNAQLRFDASPARVFSGQIAEIAEVEFDESPAEHNAADTSADKSKADHDHPVRTRYLARIVPSEPIADLPVGAVGRAKIEAAPQSLWTRMRRALTSTFRFVWNGA